MCENLSGVKYAVRGDITVTLTDDNKNKYLLTSNQYVDCSLTKELAANITKNIDDQEEKFTAIRKYIRTHYYYDYIRAVTIGKNVLPNIEYILKHGGGICQDIAALATSILRNCSIMARLVIGKADKTAHAWVEVIIGTTTYRYDPTADLYKIKKINKYVREKWF